MKQSISRRGLLKLAGGGLGLAVGAAVLPRWRGSVLNPTLLDSASAQTTPPDLVFAGTDGWISLPDGATNTPFFPDDLAPAPFNTYIFGFRNVTSSYDPNISLGANLQIQGQKMKAQHNAPLFWTQQDVPFHLLLTNLGLALRPDLTDAHTVHWHGFRNVIPFFDGEPSTSVSVPIGRDFTYVFNSHDPGTYMYHCHVEDVEHVQMGMTGLVFVRPAQDGQNIGGFTKFVYNDGDGVTGYDREFALFLSEVWAEAHWADSHIQLPEWSDYKVDFAMINGRCWPDTIAPNSAINAAASTHSLATETDANGDLLPTPGYEHLQYQPLSSLVTCNEGERVLMRFSNLGFKQSAMTLSGIKMTVVGKDATFLRNSDGTSIIYDTHTVSINAGESADVLFTAPPYQGPDPYDTYILYNRNFTTADGQAAGTNGQMTEVRVYPSGTLGAQTLPNT